MSSKSLEGARKGETHYPSPELPEYDKFPMEYPDNGDKPADVKAVNGLPVVLLVDSILDRAVKSRGSDIHIEPGETNVRIRCRIDGNLIKVATFPVSVLNPVVSRVKILAGLDIAEKRVPQDGRFKQKISGRTIDVRVSTFPTIFGEKLVLRLLDRKMHLLQLEDLGFSPKLLEDIRGLLERTFGMILVTGPAGSGKSTTLYAMLNEINSTEKNIITIEDPVEYVLEGINQTSINTRAGLTFPVGLRSILRQDPDVVMVGEIRDLETAQIAVRAANTGHLFFSTLHTGDAPTALTRLLDMGIEPFLVASSVHAVIGQRLVRRICRNCAEKYELPKGSPQRRLLGIGPDEKFIIYRGKGCTECGNTGYYGRLAVAEILLVSEQVRRMVLRKESSKEILSHVIQHEGFVSILQDGLSKVREGITTVDEISRSL